MHRYFHRHSGKYYFSLMPLHSIYLYQHGIIIECFIISDNMKIMNNTFEGIYLCIMGSTTKCSPRQDPMMRCL